MAVQIDPATGERIPEGGQIDPLTGERIPPTVQPPTLMHTIGQGAKDLGVGMLKGAGSTANSLGSLLIPDRLVKAIGATPPTKEQTESRFAPAGTMQSLGKGIEQTGEFFLPGAGEEAAAEKIGTLVPKLGSLLPRMVTSAIGSGAVNKIQGGSFGGGAAMGAGGQVIGAGLKALAPAMAETALRVRGNDRLYGRTVGEAIINDTKGIRPSSVAQSAQDKIDELLPTLEGQAANAGAAGARGSLIPARKVVANRISNLRLNRAVDSASDLNPLRKQLATDALTKLPLAADQTPSGLLNMKRGIDADFIQNWNPNSGQIPLSTAKNAYAALADEFHNAAPLTRELDQRISSLIPVTTRAEGAANNAGVLQRSAGRIGAHTGVLAGGALAGGGLGYKEGGLPGMMAGGLMGIVAPELLASPEGQMALARTLNHAGGLKPLVGSGLQLDRKKEKK